MKNLLLAFSLLFASTAAFAGDNLVCVMKKTDRTGKFVSVKVELDNIVADEPYSPAQGLDVGRDNYSFDIQLSNEGNELNIYATFYENNHVEDEVGSGTWSVLLDEAREPRQPLFTEPLQNDAGRTVLNFFCFLNAERRPTASAKILAKDENDKKVTIALERPRGLARVDGDSRSHPSIKDFRPDYTYYEACYEGQVADVKELLKALVDAANGDGDSWAELNSIRASRAGKITVNVTVTDESGENPEVYEFNKCR